MKTVQRCICITSMMEHPLSYASTPTTKPVLYKTYADMVKQWAKLYPDKDAFVEYTKDGERKSLSCSELLAKAKVFGKYLIKSGLEKGDVVVICMNNSLSMAIAICGVYFSGGVVACTSPVLQDGMDVIQFLNNENTKYFVVDTDPSDSIWDIIKAVLESAKDLQLKKIICNGADSTDEHMPEGLHTTFQNVMLENLNERDKFPVVLPEDPAIYFKTSGSTGKPKLVLHAHFTCVENAAIQNEQFGIDANSVYFCDRPFGWSGGWPRMFFGSGSTRVFLHTSLTDGENASGILSDIVAAEACTHVYLPRRLAVDLLKRPDLKNKFSTVQNIICFGERIPKTHGQLIGQFCRRLSIEYGLTETNGISIYISSDPSTFEDGIIGPPIPGIEMKIVDSSGRVVQRGDHGELNVRSIHRFSAYGGTPELFHDVVDASNWFHTGDIGYLREDGNFVIVGRTSEQITIATSKIFPFDVEKEMLKCPGVEAAIAVPVPDVMLTNAICACVILDKSPAASLDMVKEFCEKKWVQRSRATGISLGPRYYLEFEKFVISTNGKLDRKRMALEARNKLHL